MKRDKWHPTKSSYLCSDHFEEKNFRYNNERRSLIANAIPSVFSFPEHLTTKSKPERSLPKKRARIQEEQQEIDDVVCKKQKIEELDQKSCKLNNLK